MLELPGFISHRLSALHPVSTHPIDRLSSLLLFILTSHIFTQLIAYANTSENVCPSYDWSWCENVRFFPRLLSARCVTYVAQLLHKVQYSFNFLRYLAIKINGTFVNLNGFHIQMWRFITRLLWWKCTTHEWRKSAMKDCHLKAPEWNFKREQQKIGRKWERHEEMCVETNANRKAISSKGGNVEEHLNGRIQSRRRLCVIFICLLFDWHWTTDSLNIERTCKLYFSARTEKLIETGLCSYLDDLL